MSIFELILLFIVILALILSAIFYLSASHQIQGVKNYEDDDRLKTANFWLTLSYILAWISIVIVTLLIVIYFFTSAKGKHVSQNYSAHPLPRMFSAILTVVLIIIAISGFLTVNEIDNSPNKEEVEKTDVRSHVWTAAILASIATIAIAIQFLFSLGNKGNAKPAELETEQFYQSPSGESEVSRVTEIRNDGQPIRGQPDFN